MASFVQVATGSQGNAQSLGCSATPASNVTAGNLIAVCCFWSFSGSTFTVTDNQGNTYMAAPSAAEAGDYNRLKWFYTFASTTGSLTVSMGPTGVGSEAISLAVLEYSAINSSGQPDVAAVNTSVNGNCPITTVTNHDLILTAYSTSGTDNTAASGWTSRFTGTAVSNQIIVDKTDATPAGTFTGQFVTPTTGSLFAKAAIAFKPAASATTTASIASTEPADVSAIVGGGAARSVSVTLVTSPSDATPQASLTGLKWAFFDAMPWTGAGVAPVNVGTTGTTDASGAFTASLTRSTLAVGGTGYLVITDSDGTTGTTPNAFAGPVTVA